MHFFDTGYKRDILSRHFLFGSLAPKELDAILLFAQERRFADGRVIFQKGDAGSSLMAVLFGRVRIGAVSEEGKEIILNIIETGQIFGEIALLDGKERTADAMALGDCALLVIDRREFIPFLERTPQVAIHLLAILCERIRSTSLLVEDLVFLDLPQRLARLLLRLAERYGRKRPNGTRIDLKLSQRDLGVLVATSRESINKQLRAWQGQGLLSMENGLITIARLPEMRELAGLDNA